MLTAQEFNTAFSKDINEYIDNGSKLAIEKSFYNRIFDVSDTNERTSSYTSSEGVGAAEWLEEWETFKNSDLQKGYKVTYDTKQLAHNITLSYTVRLKSKDNTETLLTSTKRLVNGALISVHREIESAVTGMLDYDNASSASYAIQAPDSKPILSATHTWKSGLTFDNDLGTSAISIAHRKIVEAYAGSFTDGQGKEMPLDFNMIVVKKGGTAEQQALALYASKDAQGQYQVTTLSNINIYAGIVTIVATPYMSSGNDYMYFADTMGSGQENPFFVEFFKRPSATSDFIENESTHAWTKGFDSAVKYGIKNIPFNVLWGKVA